MHTALTTLLTAGALALPAAGVAAPAKVAPHAIHATRGVVKTIDTNRLVITRGRNRKDMTFSLNASTRRDGAIAVGAPVSVRFEHEGKADVATAVTVRPAHVGAGLQSRPATSRK
jgi:hypothetical protein